MFNEQKHKYFVHSLFTTLNIPLHPPSFPFLLNMKQNKKKNLNNPNHIETTTYP